MMTKDLTCKDCKKFTIYSGHNYGYCSLYRGDIASNTICANFETRDGKRPRFCRLASSVDEMAEAMVFCDDTAGGSRWSFSSGGDVYETYEDAKEAAKAWLMEVDE